MEESLVDTLKKADPLLLQEILKESESRLSAQLSTALASDQRAINFFGFMVAAVAVVTGASFATASSSHILSVLAAFTAIGLAVSAYFAFQAARPINFELVGNDPSSWIEDIQGGISLQHALAEQVAHYDEMLKSNRLAMGESSSNMRTAGWIAEGTVGMASIVALFQWMVVLV